jgi:fatty-acyl-CoA synthase
MAQRVGVGETVTYLLDGNPTDTVFGRAAKADERFTPTHAPLDATVAIKFTGGTSGTPKGVMQTYRGWNACIVSQRHAYGFTPADRYLVNAPLTHGASTYILPILGAGGAFVFPEDKQPATLLQTIPAQNVTTFFAPPTMIQILVDAARQANSPLPTLRNVIYGGAPMRPNRIQDAQEAFGPVIHATYGQTEAPQIITHLSAVELTDPDNLASAGRPSLMTDVAIVDAGGRRLAPGELGEVTVRGDLVMAGYLAMPEKTAETIKDGWLHTGDLGVLDERGYLFLRDRSRELIITGGFNVYPSDVETVLARHPAVADCVVFGVPDDHWGEAVHAAIETKPGVRVDVGEVLSFIKRELGSVKTPKSLHVYESLPKSAVGKVLKNKVRDDVMTGAPSGEPAGLSPSPVP